MLGLAILVLWLVPMQTVHHASLTSIPAREAMKPSLASLNPHALRASVWLENGLCCQLCFAVCLGTGGWGLRVASLHPF